MTKTISDIEGVFTDSIASGIKASGRDLVYFWVPDASAAAGVFTRNTFCAPCITHTKAAIASGKCKAIIVNSGNANAVTGEEGVQNVARTAALAAELLGIMPEQVAISSTGIIGKQLPMDTMESGIRTLLKEPQRNEGEHAAEGILTTDTCTKSCFFENGSFQVAGVAKGSGMIAPNMATMLGFLFTNVAVPQETLQQYLSEAVENSFNMITVDSDTSTSDMVLIVSSGKVAFDASDEGAVESFQSLLGAACEDLAIKIVRDGEGASRLIEVCVQNAKSKQDAKEIALSIANSPLVKTAVHGADPNWGRIIMAVGKVEGVSVNPNIVDVLFQDTAVLKDGAPLSLNRDALAEKMQQDTVKIVVDLHLGDASTTAWGCDLTKGYIDINTCYN